MSFAYYQGQEAEALTYFKKMLETQTDPESRKQLEELVNKLQRIVDAKKESESKQPDRVIQNTAWQAV
jgi:hypothetical protein